MRQFEPLLKEHAPLFKEAFRKNPPVISEYTFTNLYAWRRAYNFSLAALDGFIILKSSKGPGDTLFEPIGKGDKKPVIAQLIERSGLNFSRVPESTASLFKNEPGFTIEPDAANFDYLYETESLVALAGKKYDGKRNLIKKFKSQYAYDYMIFDGSNAAECLEFEQEWCTIKNCDQLEGLRNEREAIRDMIDNFAPFSLIGGAIKTDGKIKAVAIGERLNSDTLVMHVLKADPNMTGLYQLMMNEFLSRQAREFRYVNLEQDLGIEGLRKAKLSYHPVKMITKYTVKKCERA